MDGVRAGGDRRIDRVLAEGYLDQLATRPLSEIRGLREQADQEETDLSYLRRLLQARLDLVQDELDRRAEGRPVPADLVAHLPRPGRGVTGPLNPRVPGRVDGMSSSW